MVTFNGYVCIIEVLCKFLECYEDIMGFFFLNCPINWEQMPTNVPLTSVTGKKDFVFLPLMVVMYS